MTTTKTAGCARGRRRSLRRSWPRRRQCGIGGMPCLPTETRRRPSAQGRLRAARPRHAAAGRHGKGRDRSRWPREVRNQRRPGRSVIAVDNASDQGRIEQFAATAPAARVGRLEPEGLVVAATGRFELRLAQLELAGVATESGSYEAYRQSTGNLRKIVSHLRPPVLKTSVLQFLVSRRSPAVRRPVQRF